ncbi:MAG TPA: OsmC family protein [Gemmatimonadota bacterium]|nr:OsmC family protein [Gemmatimonadota bacterium]
MSEGTELRVELELVEGFEFLVRFGDDFEDLVMDEPEPLGEDRGPSASRVLSAAIGNCLSASLLFCLQKSKVRPSGLRTSVTTRLERNDRGRLRVAGTTVEIHLAMGEDDRGKIDRCLGLFEDYCVVTQSVRQGIDVEVAVFDRDGRELHRATEAAAAD